MPVINIKMYLKINKKHAHASACTYKKQEIACH
jgi:hypothetical protein